MIYKAVSIILMAFFVNTQTSPLGTTEQNMLIVTSLFKGATIDKKMRLVHDFSQES